MSAEKESNPRLWAGVVALLVVVCVGRVVQVEGLTWPRLWTLLVAVVVLVVLWQTRSGRRASTGGRRGAGGRVASVTRSALSTASWDGGSSASRVGRMQEKARRNEGLASGWAVLRHASGWALLRQARVLRPSLRGRWFVRAIWVGVPLARVGRLLRVWSSSEDTTATFGGPRTGKSGSFAARILDASGAVIATSTRTDLYKLCAPVLAGVSARPLVSRAGAVVAAFSGAVARLVGWSWLPVLLVAVVLVVAVSWLSGPRRREPRPVEVFNPSDTGGLASTVAFDPLTGCEVPKTAIERAGDLMAGASSGDASDPNREFWTGQARRALAALMHAAALSGASMRHVQVWLSDPDTHGRTVERYLQRSPSRALEQDAIQFFSTNQTTRSSITTSAMPALAWLADEVAAASTQVTAQRPSLDVEHMLATRTALFMIGAEEAQTAPLLTALTAHIAREARRIAAHLPGGRLDPALTFVLDEAALICTPPLDRWTADMGGLGATLHIGAQSYAQLVGKYGHAGAATILNNTGTLMVLGGTRSPDDLNIYSTLVGDRHTESATWDHRGSRQSTGERLEPVLSKAQIAGMPKFHAVIIKKELLPMVGTVSMAWKRPDVKAAQRAARRARQWATARRVLGPVFGPALLALAGWTARVDAAVAGWWARCWAGVGAQLLLWWAGLRIGWQAITGADTAEQDQPGQGQHRQEPAEHDAGELDADAGEMPTVEFPALRAGVPAETGGESAGESSEGGFGGEGARSGGGS